MPSAALAAASQLDDERARLYADLVMQSVHEGARAILEALMANGSYEYQSDFARRYVAQGKAEGRAEGEADGQARGRAQSVLDVLRVRAVDVPARRARAHPRLP
jgi:flagellar biosynthesis/type III secretory pathway protein FliH